MELYFLRHGIAVERGTPGYEDDSTRPLTPKGERRMSLAVKGYKRMGLSFDLILSSPYIRARRTAEIVAEGLKLEDKLKFSASLQYERDPEGAVEEVARKHGSLDSVLLVGHEPFMSRCISMLVSGKPDMSLVLRKGGLCKLSVEKLKYGKCASLEWLVRPRQLLLMR